MLEYGTLLRKLKNFSSFAEDGDGEVYGMTFDSKGICQVQTADGR
jgi:hypothetical protein